LSLCAKKVAPSKTTGYINNNINVINNNIKYNINYNNDSSNNNKINKNNIKNNINFYVFSIYPKCLAILWWKLMILIKLKVKN